MRMDDVPADTTLEAFRVQLGIFQRMPADRRLALALRMSDSLRALVGSGVRARHPDYTERQVKLAVIRLSLGDELFRTAFPGWRSPYESRGFPGAGRALLQYGSRPPDSPPA
jgi:hypothetical protein